MRRLVFDLETDGFLQTLTKIHCAVLVDMDSSYSELFLPETMGKFLGIIDDPEVELIGHNIYNFDLKVIEKLYGWKPYKEQKITDTFLLAQILFPDIEYEDINDSHGAIGRIFTAEESGSHSLKAWGQRVGCYKGEYNGGFDTYSDDMGKYCIQDGFTTKSLCKFLESKIYDKILTTSVTLELENDIAPILSRQQAYGVLFDKKKAEELYTTLQANLVDLKWKLQEVFKPKYISLGEVSPKRTQCRNGQRYIKDGTYTRIKLQEFNPGSRPQIVKRLISEFNWNPTEFTDKGNVKMGEEIIDNLPFEELKPLKEYLQTKLLIAKLMSGPKAWIKCVKKNGRIHGGIMQNGAITGRMTHYNPNFNIPTEKKLYGKECRELFVADKGKVIVGVDADALEMRVIAGYLSKLDGGKMIKAVLQGKKEDGTDPHTINMHAFGVNNRDLAKTLYYGYVYGAKNAKLGKILLDYGVKLEKYVPNFERNLKGMLNWVEKRNQESNNPLIRTNEYWKCWVAGKHLLELFGEASPELISLKEKIHELIKKNGYIKALDGRKLHSRTQHGELNTLCQSAGAIIMKKAQYICDQDLQESGLIPGKDYEFILTIHDEFEFEVTNDNKIIDIVRKIAENSIKKAGEFFKFPCEMKGNSKVGKNWSEVH